MTSCDTLCQKYNVRILKRGSLKGQFTHKNPETKMDFPSVLEIILSVQ